MSVKSSDDYRKHSNRNTVMPSLTVDNATKAIEFYQQVFDAKLIYLLEFNGKVTHAELLIGNSVIMLADEFPKWGTKSAKTIGDTPIVLYTYVNDVDKVYQTALGLGSKGEYAPSDMFYGDRVAEFRDPFGFKWSVARHVKDVPDEVILKEQDKMFSQSGGYAKSADDYYDKYMKYKEMYKQLKNKAKTY